MKSALLFVWYLCVLAHTHTLIICLISVMCLNPQPYATLMDYTQQSIAYCQTDQYPLPVQKSHESLLIYCHFIFIALAKETKLSFYLKLNYDTGRNNTVCIQLYFICIQLYFLIQWNLFIVDTIGTDQSVLIIKRCPHYRGSFVH